MTIKRSRNLLLTAAMWLGTAVAAHAAAGPARAGYIVESTGGTQAAANAVRVAGGRVTRELPIVDGVAARLTAAQAARLRQASNLSVVEDATVVTQSAALSTTTPDIYQRAMIGVNLLASQGINGTGVTVAVIDSGIVHSYRDSYLTDDLNGSYRVSAQYDAIQNQVIDAAHPCPHNHCANDGWGHGSHIAGLIASSNTTGILNGVPQGIAPMVKLINVKAFDDTGTANYATVLAALDWVLANRTTYGTIRVLNLSFGATPTSFYWNDPIDQAVMKLWQAGVVVVASAGNFGPKPQTIAVPGNTPYVITVGAMTDNFTPNDPTDDGVTSFSSAGPTYEGFVKPDLVAPGGHLAAYMDTSLQQLPAKYPQFGSTDPNLFIMSGTSQAAAVTSGVVALMLQANPSLTPDQVKCRLIESATAAIGKGGKAAYSVFQQGAGRINAYAAVYSQAYGCANVGLNIAADLAGTQHFGGPAHQNPSTGAFYVANSLGQPINADGYLWNQSYAKTQGYLWNNGYLWNQGYLWNNGYLWNQGYLWNNGYLWNQGYLWNNGTLSNQNAMATESSRMSMESWNAQE